MIGPGILHAALAMEKRTPLLQMTPDELVRTYMTPLTLGVFLSCFFYGMFLTSAYLYFTQFKPDTWMNRGVVILLLCLTTADTVAGAVRIFRMTVLVPNNLAYILDVTKRPEDWLTTVLLLLTVLSAQLFMIFRILSFSRRMSDWNQTPEGAKRGRRSVWVLGVCLMSVWAICVGACVANMAVFYQVTNYMQLLVPSSRLARLFRGTSLIMPCVLCLMDLVIAIIMTLQYRKARTGFGVSDHILSVLMNVIIRNGAMMAGVMLTQLLVTLFQVLWGNFMPLFYGKLHALTVLAILTEPRVARAEWFKSQESGRPSASVVAPAGAGAGVGRRPGSSAGPVETPYMDYTRPSQYNAPRSGDEGRRCSCDGCYSGTSGDGSGSGTGSELRTPSIGACGKDQVSADIGLDEKGFRSEGRPAHAACCRSPASSGDLGSARRRQPHHHQHQHQQPRHNPHDAHRHTHQRQPAYIPANPRCAHCHMPWLPSDLDTPLSYLSVQIDDKDQPMHESPGSLYTYGEKEKDGYFGARAAGRESGIRGQQRGLGMGHPHSQCETGARAGEVARVPVLPRTAYGHDEGQDEVRPRQLSLAEMLSDLNDTVKGEKRG